MAGFRVKSTFTLLYLTAFLRGEMQTLSLLHYSEINTIIFIMVVLSGFLFLVSEELIVSIFRVRNKLNTP